MKLLIVDLDGTLFDTKDVNYNAYKEAMKPYGYELDYEYYCNYCNGRHYLDFLPQITTNDNEVLTDIHNKKKISYEKYFEKAVMNKGLVDIIRLMKSEYKTAVVTTASKKNCFDILNKFGIYNLFDLILTRDDISNSKPNPEGFIKAMEYFEATASETIIFEDSDVGLEAAERSGAYFYRTYKYN